MKSANQPDDLLQGLELEGLGSPEAFQRFVDVPSFRDTTAKILDIPETIGELGYGSHQFFRYYGKFPSFVGKELIDRFALPDHAVLDIYSGSGTTQVEAQIRGLVSYGTDINPLAVLASNVKTSYFDYSRLDAAFGEVMRLLRAENLTPYVPTGMTESRLAKWFPERAMTDLGQLHAAISTLHTGPEREFLLVCFLAIVRRCSVAFDGEVRPHVNKNKKPRSPIEAFSRKFGDMLSGARELDSMRPAGVPSLTVLGDNRSSETYAAFERPVGLVVSHPPYLNSFNYLQVFSLEFAWAEEFPEVWRGHSMKTIRAMEQKAWPATDTKIVRGYYEAIALATQRAHEQLVSGGTLAVVVGDATIHGVLEPVHTKIWDDAERLGFTPSEIWYRTTHYGVGKYAYSHRADYHGDAEKKDAIMFFSKR